MKKKLHKTGTTILLALAPACALGVVGGLVVYGIQESYKEKEVTQEEWETAYSKTVEEYNKSYDTYGQTDVTFKIDGVVKTNSMFYTINPENKPEGVTERFGKTSHIACLDIHDEYWNDHKLVVAGGALKYEINNLKATASSVQYLKSKYTYSLLITQPDNTSTQYFMNSYGYVTKEIVVGTDKTITYEINYVNSPRLVTEFQIKPFYRPRGGLPWFNHRAELKKDTLYTITFNFDPSEFSVSGYKLRFFRVIGENSTLELSEVSVQPSSLDWTYQEYLSQHVIKGTPITTKTSITIKFKVNVDCDNATLNFYGDAEEI